jgi:hypothetical protein
MTMATTQTKKATATKPEPVPTLDVENIGELSYGPYKEHTFVSPPMGGEIRVEAGTIVRFRKENVYSKKAQAVIEQYMPYAERVYIDDPRLLPGNTKKTLEAQAGT